MNSAYEGKGFIGFSDVVKVTRAKHIVEIQYMEKMNTVSNIKKIDRDSYIDLRTGEIKEFVHSENRKQNYNSLRQTFKKLRYLINNNFEGKGNELHVTLTYKDNMTDTKRLYSDFDKFMKKLKYKYKKLSSIDYISVIEPQERGAWHSHLLLRFNDFEDVFIKNKELRDIWGQGYVTIKSLNDVDNIGAYLSAYLADVELTDENMLSAFEKGVEVQMKVVEGKEKKFIKGGRLHLYPSGMNLFRKSKGIEYPERETMSYKNAKKIVGSAQPHFSKSYTVENEDFTNMIIFEQYNLKR